MRPSCGGEYRHVHLGKPIVFYIPFNGTGSAQYPRRHDLSHQHSSRIKNLKIEKEEQRAVNKACLLSEELGLPYLFGYALAATTHLGPARWLADTGSGWDLVAKGDVHRSVKAEKSENTINCLGNCQWGHCCRSSG